jgi:hypothetical protein
MKWMLLLGSPIFTNCVILYILMTIYLYNILTTRYILISGICRLFHTVNYLLQYTDTIYWYNLLITRDLLISGRLRVKTCPGRPHQAPSVSAQVPRPRGRAVLERMRACRTLPRGGCLSCIPRRSVKQWPRPTMTTFGGTIDQRPALGSRWTLKRAGARPQGITGGNPILNLFKRNNSNFLFVSSLGNRPLP